MSKSKALGWTYQTELEDGIRLAYEDFLNNENRYKSNKELLEKNKQTSQEVYNDLENK